MFLAVNPYHITTRELPAMAAFLLGEHVVTMLPTPFNGAGREHVDRAVRHVPRYLRLMQSWSWAMPLWQAGVVGSMLAGEEPGDDVRIVCERIATQPSLAGLRPLLHASLHENEYDYLELVAADMLKGGPDPGISVPVAASIDRFATRHGLVVSRSQPVSVAQKAEIRLGTRLHALAIPLLRQASGASLVHARTLLKPELEALRDLLGDFADLVAAGEPADLDRQELKEIVADYTDAFERRREEIVAPQDEDDPRVVPIMATLSIMLLPADAVLRSSVAAARAVATTLGTEVSDDDPSLPVLHDPSDVGRLVTIVVHEIGRSARR